MHSVGRDASFDTHQPNIWVKKNLASEGGLKIYRGLGGPKKLNFQGWNFAQGIFQPSIMGKTSVTLKKWQKGGWTHPNI